MDIIIVGCGKVGIALAEVLSEEHNVTMIDKDENLINAAINDFDIMGIAGNCLQTNVQGKYLHCRYKLGRGQYPLLPYSKENEGETLYRKSAQSRIREAARLYA